MLYQKKLRAALVLSTLMTVLGSAEALAGDMASVDVTATLVNRTCTPDWTNDPNKTNIKLGTIDAASAAKGDLKTVEFTLGLTDCNDVKKVKVTAQGHAHPSATTEFGNTASNGALGFAVHLEGGPNEDTRLKPDASTSVTYPLTNNAVDMKFKATLEKVADKTTSGEFSAPITLTMDYE
ncbi:fimbrial protein [Pantoea sp. RRHST58]|uniref:fimbrial protein n=1 Tax=Pantoea sp. RRHST58 TaxID=3425183 RepID=UPI003DA078A0